MSAIATVKGKKAPRVPTFNAPGKPFTKAQVQKLAKKLGLKRGSYESFEALRQMGACVAAIGPANICIGYFTQSLDTLQCLKEAAIKALERSADDPNMVNKLVITIANLEQRISRIANDLVRQSAKTVHVEVNTNRQYAPWTPPAPGVHIDKAVITYNGQQQPSSDPAGATPDRGILPEGDSLQRHPGGGEETPVD